MLVAIFGVFRYLTTRPPVLEISPSVPVYNFDRAVINCTIINKSLFPIKILKPFLSQTFTVEVIGPNGMNIRLGLMQDKTWDKTDEVILLSGQTHKFSIDILRSSSAGTKFAEPRKDAPPQKVAEYMRLINKLKAKKLYDITVPGTYKIQVIYWIARNFKEHPEIGKGLWTGEIRSNTIEVYFTDEKIGQK